MVRKHYPSPWWMVKWGVDKTAAVVNVDDLVQLDLAQGDIHLHIGEGAAEGVGIVADGVGAVSYTHLVLPNGQIVDDSTGLVETLEAIKPAYDEAVKNGDPVGICLLYTSRCV